VGLQWVFNAYVIAFGGLLLVGGRLADLLGPRRIFTAGFAVLAGSSLLAGLAWTIGGGAKASAINVRSKVTG
jgi:MFS family permease